MGIVIAVPIVILLSVVMAVVVLVLKNYHRAGPNEALIVSGRNPRIIHNGSGFVMPVVNKVQKLSLNQMSAQVRTKEAISQEGVKLDVHGIALFKIAGDEEGMRNAAERFMDMSPEQIANTVCSKLEADLRGVVGRMTPEEINADREKFRHEVIDQAQTELDKSGIKLDSFNISEIDDAHGYLDALGKARTAQVKRDADIAEAEATKEAAMRKAAAKQASEVAQANAEAAIAEAIKERDVKKAQYDAERQREQARAAQAGPQEEAKAAQMVATEKAALAKQVAEQRQQELVAEVIKPAEAERERAIITAEAAKKRMTIEAEGDLAARRNRAEAQAYEQEQEGKGEATKTREVANANADAERARGAAAAEVTRNTGTAQADVERAKGEAQGAAVRAVGEAEAAARSLYAQAQKEYNDAASDLEIRLALIKTLAEIVAAAASPLGSIQEMRVLDFGGGGANGKSPAMKVMGMAPEAIAQTLEIVKAITGVDLAALAQGFQRKIIDGESPDGRVTVEEIALPARASNDS